MYYYNPSKMSCQGDKIHPFHGDLIHPFHSDKIRPFHDDKLLY